LTAAIALGAAADGLALVALLALPQTRGRQPVVTEPLPSPAWSTQVGCRPWADRLVVACAADGRNLMEDYVYRLSEMVGTSSEGIDQAIRNAVAPDEPDASQPGPVPGLRDPRRHRRRRGCPLQVTLKLGFRLEE
jgi:hypothetical protein